MTKIASRKAGSQTAATQRESQSQASTLLAVADELESNLPTLDEMGAHIAAAHLDVAILRLREKAGDKAIN